MRFREREKEHADWTDELRTFLNKEIRENPLNP